ncbi:MAG: hypothetical protein LBR07_03685 [Puniceicoccales bacterium]|jgi:hypothetical protein|nr:hypothetical protein [Puniceicoccales bacterium]
MSTTIQTNPSTSVHSGSSAGTADTLNGAAPTNEPEFITDAEWNRRIAAKILALPPCPPKGNHDTTLELCRMGRGDYYADR